MDRRTLLKLIAAASLADIGNPVLAARELRVVVAGAGIVGASIAYHLAKAGASVTVVDQEGPATHASRGTFAWINATWAKQPRYYHSLNQDSLSNWHSLQQDLGIPVKWGGSLEWFDNDARQARLKQQIAEQVTWGEDARMVAAAELASLEPGVDFGNVQQAAFSTNDGAVDPVLATQILLAAAKELGAQVRYPCKLTGVEMSFGRLEAVTTDQGPVTADKLVLATGAEPDMATRLADIEIPQRSTPGVIAITAPLPPLINRIVVAPGIHMHQRVDGRMVLGEQGGAPQNTAHEQRLQGRPNAFPSRELALEHAARILAVAKQFVPAISTAVIEDVYIGWRPLPLDGHPVLGASPARPDVYLAIMHSGVSLAPIVGQLAAREIIAGETIARLDSYRPDRKFERVKRY
ncbi:MAG: FAD-dependent oxidoreductase [Halioglobus sp.]